MTNRVIRQAITEESLFQVIGEWCKQGAGKKTHTLHILTAFASGKGVQAISPFIDIFLADGNAVTIIFGTDRNGTDRKAVESLNNLQKTYPGQLTVKHFKAPSKVAIFHPKLYIYDHGAVSFVIGSANLTQPGLGLNFESLLLYENVAKREQLTREIYSIWNTYAKPLAPLRAAFLKELNDNYARKLIRELPEKSSREYYGSTKGTKDLWYPISKVDLPRSEKVLQRKPFSKIRANTFLLMDILNETRVTQMQLPIHVVENFFKIKRDEPSHIYISILTKDGLTQPIERPIVISSGKEGLRLMRRLEMPQIKNYERPLVALFLKMPQKMHYAHKLFPKGSRPLTRLSKLLDQFGQQGNAVRRYIIGSRRDIVWEKIDRIVSS